MSDNDRQNQNYNRFVQYMADCIKSGVSQHNSLFSGGFVMPSIVFARVNTKYSWFIKDVSVRMRIPIAVNLDSHKVQVDSISVNSITGRKIYQSINNLVQMIIKSRWGINNPTRELLYNAVNDAFGVVLYDIARDNDIGIILRVCPPVDDDNWDGSPIYNDYAYSYYIEEHKACMFTVYDAYDRSFGARMWCDSYGVITDEHRIRILDNEYKDQMSMFGERKMTRV